jgi:hypothetical protein
MPMNPEVKARWVESLLEPGIEQGHNMLRDAEGKRCCLDILNQQCSDDGYQPQPRQLNDDGQWFYDDELYGDELELEDSCYLDTIEDGHGLQSSVLTAACIEYAGLDDRDPSVKYRKGEYHLTYLNDVMELTFPEIAEIIKADETL